MLSDVAFRRQVPAFTVENDRHDEVVGRVTWLAGRECQLVRQDAA